MTALLDDRKLKPDVLDGYDTLNKLLAEFDEGAQLYKPASGGAFVNFRAAELSDLVDELKRHRGAFRQLMVGATIKGGR